MEEILELKGLLHKQDYAAALTLVGEMEEMSRDDKVTKIKSFMKILLLHLIKQSIEKRTTRSWDLSIENAQDYIKDLNKRRKAGGHYLTMPELIDIIEEAYPYAIKAAALETAEGQYTYEQLTLMIDADLIKKQALDMIVMAN